MLIRQTLLYMPAQLIGPVAQFISILVWTHWLSPAEMGAFAILIAVQELAFLGCLSWFSVYTVRYFDHAGPADDLETYRRTEAVVVSVALALSVLIGWLGVLALSEITPSPYLMIAAIAFVAVRLLASHMSERARATGQIFQYSVLQIAWPVGGLALGLVLVAIFGASVANVLMGYAVAQAVAIGAVWPALGLGWPIRAPSRAMIIKAIQFGSAVAVGGPLFWFSGNAIRFVVEYAEGTAAVGLVTVGWALGQRAASFAAQGVTAAAFPLAVKRLREGDMADGYGQMRVNALLLWLALAPAAAGLYAIGPDLVRLLVAEPYQAVTVAILPAAILSGALRNLRSHSTEQVFLLAERPQYTMMVEVFDAIATLIGCVIGLSLYGLVGAAWGALVASVISLALSAAIARARFGFDLPYREGVPIAAASLVMMAAVMAIPPAGSVFWLMIKIAAGGAVFVALIAAFHPRQTRELAGKALAAVGR